MSAEATKLAKFIAEKKLDARRILAASAGLEALTREDRQIRLNKRRARRSEGEIAKETRKPHSGRPVTNRAMAAALTGGEKISGPTKTRILKAINKILEQKKIEAIDLRAIF